MSKSLGNVLLVRDLLDEAPGEAIRFALLGAHYRQPLDWSADGLIQAKRGLDRLYGVLRDLQDVPDMDEYPQDLLAPIVAALEDDLNFPEAIAGLFGLAKAARQAITDYDRAAHKKVLLEAGDLLGLLQEEPARWFGQPEVETEDVAKIQGLVDAREVARLDKEFAVADRIREELAALGIEVQDRPDGPIWQRKAS